MYITDTNRVNKNSSEDIDHTPTNSIYFLWNKTPKKYYSTHSLGIAENCLLAPAKYILREQTIVVWIFISRWSRHGSDLIGIELSNTSYVLLLQKYVKPEGHIVFSNLLTLSVPVEGYSRNAPYGLVCTFWLGWLSRYLCWSTNNTRGYHPPSNQRFGTDMVY